MGGAMTLREQRRIARQMLKLHGRPYDPDTSDDDNRAFEELALKLARGVLAGDREGTTR